MKKQIFILVLAFFAIGISTSFAQIASDPPTCVATALSPAVGSTYNYATTITALPGSYSGIGNYTWYITKNVNVLTGAPEAPNGPEFVASGSATYNTPTAGPGGNNLSIVWNSAALALNIPYYLVVKYSENNTLVTCTASNMKVYRIKPVNTWWLKIASASDALGTAGGVSVCAADLSKALMTENAGVGTIEYLYGQNVLFAKISSTNYTGNWTPTMRVTGLFGDQTIASFTWVNIGGTTGSGTFTAASVDANGNGTYSTSAMPSLYAGQDIAITLTLNNNHHEALADQPIALAINGIYSSGATNFKHKSNVNGPCTDATDFEDTVNKVINARPGVNQVAPSTFAVPNPPIQP